MFRFTIRDVLWLTVVVGLVMALGVEWSRDHKAAREVAFYRERLQTFGDTLQDTIDAIEKEGYKWDGNGKVTLHKSTPAKQLQKEIRDEN